MSHSAQHAKYVTAIAPAAIIDNTSATAAAIDCKGAGYCEIILELGATDIAITALKLQESDDNSSYADVTGSSFASGYDTDGNALALPSATDDGQTIVWQVNCAGGKRKRYLKVVATFGDGTAGGYLAGSARLSEIGYSRTSDTDFADGSVCRV